MSKELEAAKALVKMLEEKENTGKSQLSELNPGQKFLTDIGKFIVLDHTEAGTLVITDELYKKDVQFDYDTKDCNKSSLKELCDDVILNDFAEVFGAENIVEHEADLMTLDGQKLYENPLCKVRPLTFDEARKYNQYLVNKDLPDWYWTCTVWSSEKRGWKYSIAVVSPSGGILNVECVGSSGVRPVCILKSDIFVSKED